VGGEVCTSVSCLCEQPNEAAEVLCTVQFLRGSALNLSLSPLPSSSMSQFSASLPMSVILFVLLPLTIDLPASMALLPSPEVWNSCGSPCPPRSGAILDAPCPHPPRRCISAALPPCSSPPSMPPSCHLLLLLCTPMGCCCSRLSPRSITRISRRPSSPKHPAASPCL
jgi:hypothetical protein